MTKSESRKCDSKIACLWQSIEMNDYKHVYRQSQVRKPTGSGVEWAECSLIIGTGYWVQDFSLILDSSVGLSTGIQSAGDSVPRDLGFESCIQQRKTTCLLSIRKSLACARASKLATKMYTLIRQKHWSNIEANLATFPRYNLNDMAQYCNIHDIYIYIALF